MADKKIKCPPPRLLTLGLVTTGLSLFTYKYQYQVTGLTSDAVKQFINDSLVLSLHDPQEVRSTIVDYNSTELNPLSNQIDVIWALIASATQFSATLGAFVAPFLSDNFGRRISLFVFVNFATIAGSICVMIAKYCDSWVWLLVGRLSFGLNAGLALPLVPVYLAECSPDEFRGMLGSFHAPFVYSIGVLAQFLTMKSVLGTYELWQIAYGLGAIPAIVQICLYWVVPESPEYDYIQNKNGASALRTIRQYFGKEYSSSNSKLSEARLVAYEKQKALRQQKVTIISAFKRRDLWPTIVLAISLGAVRPACGEYLMPMYTTDLLRSFKISEKYLEIFAVSSQASAFLVACVGSMLVEVLGRRIMLFTTMITIFICWTGSAIVQLLENPSIDWLTPVLYMVTYLAYPIGCATITWFMAAELTNQQERSAIMSVSLISGTFCLFLSSFMYPILESRLPGSVIILILFLIPLGTLTTFLWFCLPETKNRPTADIVAEIGRRFRFLAGKPAGINEYNDVTGIDLLEDDGYILSSTAGRTNLIDFNHESSELTTANEKSNYGTMLN